MPNRIIHERATTSETLAALDDGSERHFWRLLVLADDYGYLDGREEVIRARAYPMMLTKVTTAESERRTQVLASVNLLHLFSLEGKRYGHFPTWDKYQQKRAKYSKFPQLQSCAGICNQMLSDSLENRDPIPSPPLPSRHYIREARSEKRPVWTPPDWFVPLTTLSGYKIKNHQKAADGIEAACKESSASVAEVVAGFAKQWPTLKVKYRWDDPIATLKGKPLEIAIDASRRRGTDGKASAQNDSHPADFVNPDYDFSALDRELALKADRLAKGLPWPPPQTEG